MKTENQQNNFHIAVYKQVYKALIHIAKKYPLNQDDLCPILLEPVIPNHRVYITSGEFYNKHALAQHTIARGFRNPLHEANFCKKRYRIFNREYL